MTFSNTSKLRRIGVASLVAMAALLASLPARADFNDGVLALTGGRYDEALATFVPLAETSDHGWSQYFLGRMYAGGMGVQQDYEEAAKWLRKASEKGLADAQYRLGGLYAAGQGVPLDYEYAYGWFSCALHLKDNKFPQAESALMRASENLTEDQLVEARKLAKQLIADFGTEAEKHPSIQNMENMQNGQ